MEMIGIQILFWFFFLFLIDFKMSIVTPTYIIFYQNYSHRNGMVVLNLNSMTILILSFPILCFTVKHYFFSALQYYHIWILGKMNIFNDNVRSKLNKALIFQIQHPFIDSLSFKMYIYSQLYTIGWLLTIIVLRN